MIRALIANINEQANGDTNLNQWCLDSKAENDQSRVEVRAAADNAGAQILWAQDAIAGFKDQTTYFGSEVQRLEKHAVDINGAGHEESEMLSKQLADHGSAREILQESVEVLKGACDIDDAELTALSTGPTLLQSGGSGKAKALQTKHGQCTEAAKLILQAKAKLGSLDGEISKYKTAHDSMVEAEVGAAQKAVEQRTRDLASTKSALSSRVLDLETAKGNRRRKEKDLLLVEAAARAIDKKCIVKELHSERVARKADEIDALKSAYKVLNGEEIPVDTSLLTLGSRRARQTRAHDA